MSEYKKLFGTITGRWTSSQPNIQTLPRDGANWKFGPYGMMQVSFPTQDGACDILRDIDVIYAGTHRARVKQFAPNKDSVEIEFNEKGLIPPTMWVPLLDVQYAYGGNVINPQTHCPKCDMQWKETLLARFSVWDCPSCGAKKEDHVS